MKPLLLFALFPGCALAQPMIAGCPSFPANNIWNAAVDGLPVQAESAAYVAKIGAAAVLRLDDLMPINVVPQTQAKVTVGRISTPESDAGPYAIPAKPQVEAGSDAHLIVVEQGSCILYELFAVGLSAGKITAESGSKWDLNSNALRPDGWTSADAAGLPIMPGILRYAEIAAGHVDHALRFTAPYTRGNSVYQWPARHYASHHPDGPPMGQRLRLKGSFDISGFPPNLQMILRALKKYGVMLADNGQPWGMEHDVDSRWNATELVMLHRVLGSDMEAVDVSSLMSDTNSGIAGPAPGMVIATDALGRPNAVKLGPGLGIVDGTLTILHR